MTFWKFKGNIDMFCKVRNHLELQIGPLVIQVQDDPKFMELYVAKSSVIESSKVN